MRGVSCERDGTLHGERQVRRRRIPQQQLLITNRKLWLDRTCVGGRF
jgi:hypothetical protein